MWVFIPVSFSLRLFWLFNNHAYLRQRRRLERTETGRASTGGEDSTDSPLYRLIRWLVPYSRDDKCSSWWRKTKVNEFFTWTWSASRHGKKRPQVILSEFSHLPPTPLPAPWLTSHLQKLQWFLNHCAFETQKRMGIRIRESGKVFNFSADSSGVWSFLRSQLVCSLGLSYLSVAWTFLTPKGSYYPTPVERSKKDLSMAKG